MELIAQISDLHLNDGLSKHFSVNIKKNLSVIFKDLKRKNISDIVFTGDYGNKDSFYWLKSQIDKYHFRTTFILGNHDSLFDLVDSNLIPKSLVKEKDQLYFSQNIYNNRIFMYLDTSKGEIDYKQIIWLKKEIDQMCDLVIFSHHPIIDCDSWITDYQMGLKNKESVQKIFFNHKGTIQIYSGHYHTELFIEKDNIKQYITPAVIMQLNYENNKITTDSFNFGYKILYISEDCITSENVLFSGQGINKPWN